MPPMFEPANDRRAGISENACTDSGFSGAPTLTSVPSTASSRRYASMSSVALTVLMIRSNEPASVVNVSSSEVA